VATTKDQVRRTLGLFGHDEEAATRIVIAGGGNIGLYVARTIESRQHRTRIKIIENSRDRAVAIADELRRTVVLHGSALDQKLLMEADIQEADLMVALTNDDQVNILSSVMAKQLGCKSNLALLNNPAYHDFAGILGIDAQVNPRTVTISRVLQHVRRGRIRAVHSVQKGPPRSSRRKRWRRRRWSGRRCAISICRRACASARSTATARSSSRAAISRSSPRTASSSSPWRARSSRLSRCSASAWNSSDPKSVRGRMSRIAYVNGRYVPHGSASVHIEDRGYQFADGVYEVCEVARGYIVDMTRHLDRLDRSLRELRIAWPMGRKALETVMREVVRRNRVINGLVYLQVTRGVARRDHFFPAAETPPAIVVTAKRTDPRLAASKAEKGIKRHHRAGKPLGARRHQDGRPPAQRAGPPAGQGSRRAGSLVHGSRRHRQGRRGHQRLDRDGRGDLWSPGRPISAYCAASPVPPSWTSPAAEHQGRGTRFHRSRRRWRARGLHHGRQHRRDAGGGNRRQAGGQRPPRAR
jgi:hypothetical protein